MGYLQKGSCFRVKTKLDQMEYDKQTTVLDESYRFWSGKEEEMGYLLFQSTALRGKLRLS